MAPLRVLPPQPAAMGVRGGRPRAREPTFRIFTVANLGYTQKYRRSIVISASQSASDFCQPRPALAMDDDLPPRIPGVLPGRSTSGLREATRSRLVFEEPENGMTSRSLCAEISEARPGRRGRWLPRAAPTAP